MDADARGRLAGWSDPTGTALLAAAVLVALPVLPLRLLGWGLAAWGTMRDRRRGGIVACLFVPLFIGVGTFDVGFTLKPAQIWLVLLGFVLLRDPTRPRFRPDRIEVFAALFLAACLIGSVRSADPAGSLRLWLNWGWAMAWLPLVRRLGLSAADRRACLAAIGIGTIAKGVALVGFMIADPKTFPGERAWILHDLAILVPATFLLAARDGRWWRAFYLPLLFLAVVIASKSVWLASIAGGGVAVILLLSRRGFRGIRGVAATSGWTAAIVLAVLAADFRAVRVTHDALRMVLPVRDLPWDPVHVGDLLWSLFPSVFPHPSDDRTASLHDRRWASDHQAYLDSFRLGSRVAYALSGQRVMGYANTWDAFASRPVTGIGLSFPIEMPSHNIYLILLARTGLLGFAAFLFLVGFLLVRPADAEEGDPDLADGLRAGLAAWLVYGFVEFALNYFVVWGVAGLLLASAGPRPAGKNAS